MGGVNKTCPRDEPEEIEMRDQVQNHVSVATPEVDFVETPYESSSSEMSARIDNGTATPCDDDRVPQQDSLYLDVGAEGVSVQPEIGTTAGVTKMIPYV